MSGMSTEAGRTMRYTVTVLVWPSLWQRSWRPSNTSQKTHRQGLSLATMLVLFR